MRDVLSLVFDLSRPNYPRVGITVNGLTDLDGGEHPEGHHPERLLGNGALLPRDVPHRVALYGCCCGEFGCSTLTALIVADGSTVRWTDFAEGDGHFDEALPYGDLPDPLPVGRRTAPDPHGGGLELEFDPRQYLGTVRAAAAGRQWETRPMAIARLTCELLGWDPEARGKVMAWGQESEAVAANVCEDGGWSTFLVPVPGGTPAKAAAELASLLRRHHPRDLDGARPVM